jgi:AcrR family transcriptional regulator
MSSVTPDATQQDRSVRLVGRPRDARVDRAIIEATLRLIAERSVHEFRTEDVASRAGVGKGAIYRRYPSKDELVTRRSSFRTPARPVPICLR